MKNLLVIIAALAVFGCTSVSNPVVQGIQWDTGWYCDGLQLYEKGSAGLVIYQGIEIDADYKTEGISRRWNWGVGEMEDYSVYRYAIVLSNNVARFYDFQLAGDDGKAVRVSTHFCEW